MKPSRVLLWLVLLGVPIGAAVVTRHTWLPLLQKRTPPPHTADDGERPKEKPRILELSPQARQNLGLVARPAKLQSYWRTVQIPGEIADRAGVSDRGLVEDAIVDVENIFRRLKENNASPTPRPALLVVYEASREIRSAIVFGTTPGNARNMHFDGRRVELRFGEIGFAQCLCQIFCSHQRSYRHWMLRHVPNRTSSARAAHAASGVRRSRRPQRWKADAS
ncbi:hypothetical protein [Planctomyces sp. SH-PL14]|uniref:hypothetical protein n=1 Tax=Planctomyces sp. SH-PL14 TaxID=1632864 RepID=UPI00078BA735|nr:hypothetical protein [Planctomyces sp. SH-PL14]AMV18345.1 hypothetical protein VT03_10675 [Planctomyces sp. SH-PL14]